MPRDDVAMLSEDVAKTAKRCRIKTPFCTLGVTLHGIQAGQDLALEPHCAIPQSLTDNEIMYTYTSGDSQYPQTVVCPLAPRGVSI